MAALLQDYMADSCTLRRSAEGTEVVRAQLIGDFVSVDFGRLVEAMEAEGVPAYGAVCPLPSLDALKVVDQQVEIIDPKIVRVISTYRKPKANEKPDPTTDTDGPEKSITCSLTNVKTNRDVTGADMIVSHTVEAVVVTQSVEMEVQRPVAVLKYTRRESTLPLSRAVEKLGCINSDVFDGCAIGTVMFSNISATTRNGGANFDVSYEFTYNPFGWTSLGYWIDPKTGRPPADLVPGVGIISFSQYVATAFSTLSLA